MIKKALNPMKGIKVRTDFSERRKKVKERTRAKKEDENRLICLTCKKSAKDCKGDCFGK